jgi:glutaminyl-tRNA synthetase
MIGAPSAHPGQHHQPERLAYFYTDPKDSKLMKPVFNRTVTLKDSFAKAK